MKTTFGIDAFKKPYFSKAGDYAMYLFPPGRQGGGPGDLAYAARDTLFGKLVDVLADNANNPYWKWYSTAVGFKKEKPNYYAFLRKTQNNITPKKPTDLPQSKVFWGTGLAVLNSNLLDANENVQIQFKSCPSGSFSHGYDSSNSFFFNAWNDNLLINTGRRDIYGSPHHDKWMWSTRSVNSITVNGQGQYPRSFLAKGKIERFESTPEYDYVVGQAADAYPAPVDASGKVDLKRYPRQKALDVFTRSIVFFKKDNFFLIYDHLKAPAESTFDLWFHAPYPFLPENEWFPNGLSKNAIGQTPTKRWKKDVLFGDDFMSQIPPLTKPTDIVTRSDKAACRIQVVTPGNLAIVQTNQYDPNPFPSYKIREFHLTLSTVKAKKEVRFLTLVQAWKIADQEKVPRARVNYKMTENGMSVKVSLDNGVTRSFDFKEECEKTE